MSSNSGQNLLQLQLVSGAVSLQVLQAEANRRRIVSAIKLRWLLRKRRWTEDGWMDG